MLLNLHSAPLGFNSFNIVNFCQNIIFVCKLRPKVLFEATQTAKLSLYKIDYFRTTEQGVESAEKVSTALTHSFSIHPFFTP